MLISEKGISTDEEKIFSVRDWPVPRTRRQVRSFLAFCSYYSKFVKNSSLIACDRAREHRQSSLRVRDLSPRFSIVRYNENADSNYDILTA